MTDDLERCPKCGREVDLMTSRDINIHETYISCSGNPFDCDFNAFHCSSIAFVSGQHTCDDQIVSNYNAWAKTKPEQYGCESWIHYSKGGNND